MSLPSSGPISFYDIQQLFGGTNPISFNEYFSDGLYITDNSIRSSSFQQSTPIPTITSSSPNAFHIINTVETDSSYQYIAFQNNSSTSIITYDLDFSEETICDVLVVGGGGSGGVPNAGGGGAGGVVYINNIAVKNAKIAVGKGGDGITTTTGFYTGNKGENSAFSYDNNNTARHVNRFLPIQNNEINVSVENNLYVFNDTKYQAYDFISLSIGVYYFKNVPIDNPIGFVIGDSLNFNVLSGTVFTGDTKTINGIDVVFYTGDIEIEIIDDFGTISYFSYYNGYMGGYNRIKFKIDFNNYVTVTPNLSLHNTTNDKEYMIFTYDENNSVSGQTSYQLTLDRTVKCSILIVAGGGGSGAGGTGDIGGRGSGGGGAGGLIYIENIDLNPGIYNIKVGSGGNAYNAAYNPLKGDNGNDSSFDTYVAYGGGGGGTVAWEGHQNGDNSNSRCHGKNGGSGGGGGDYNGEGGTSSQNNNPPGIGFGNNGGSTTGYIWNGSGGGGGGGAGGVGGSSTYDNSNPGEGGLGKNIDITGINIMYASGGRGGYQGAPPEGEIIDVEDNKGNGGKGVGFSYNGNRGGSGVVIIRFEDMIEKIITYRFNQTLNYYPFIQSDNDNLVAWYKFDLGEELTDSKGNYPLTNDGSVTFSSDTKMIGKSSYFPNSNYDGYLNITGGFNPYNIWNGNGISFSVWYNLNHSGTDTYGRIFEFGSSNTSRFSITTKDNGSNVIALQLYNSSWLGNVAVGSGTLDDIWHHLVWSIDTSGVWTCYIDGVNENINITASIPNMSFTLNRLGKSIYHDTDQQDLKGYLDDFRIYNKVLTENEVLLLYNQYNQTKYELTLTDNVECDILIVAGGGGGGAGYGYGCGGGGGAGGVIYKTNETLYGTYDIFVGKGGIGMTYSYSSMENYNNGTDSGIYDSSENILYLTKGGGAGGARKTNGASGGSGGGGGGGSNSTPGTAGSSVNTGPYNHTIGFNGGDGNRYNKGGGGGGAGGIGETATGTDTSAGNGYNEGIAGKGGAPIIIDITGENKAYAGGGGGGSWQVEPGEGGSVVIDGQIVKVGGDGGWGATGPVAGHGVTNTGSGGGGARHNASAGTTLQNAGDGGSGVIIIRIKDKYKISNTFTQQIITYPIIDADSINLMAWYKFDGDFNDSSGNNNHLIPSSVSTPTLTSQGIIGNAMRFINNVNTNTFTNGVRDGTAKIPTIDLVNKEFSISIWIKLVNNLDTSHSGIFILGENERVSTTGSIELYCNYDGVALNKISIIYRTNTYVDGGIIISSMNLDTWYNFVIVVNSTSLNVFTNNSITKSFTFTNGLPDGIYDTNYFGCFNNSEYVNTKDDYLIDDFRIYDKALTQEEVTSLYNHYNIGKDEHNNDIYISKNRGFVAQGGGGGGKWYSNNNNIDGNGGSGGGGGGGNNFPGGVSTQLTSYNYGLGNNGGSGSTTYAGGGGGGATFPGNDAYSTDYGADGGDGIDMSFLFGYNIGDNGWFGGGGGGGGTQYYGLGGKGGGGMAGNTTTDLSHNGMKNTGGGGGADRRYGKSGKGGSGVVIVRYKSYVEYYYKQKRESENNYITENLNTTNLHTNFVDIDFYNGKTHGGTLQKAKGLLLYPGTYRVSYYKGYQPSNGSDQSTLYKCEPNGSGGWIMNYECIPLVRAIGAQGNLLGEYIQEITIPDIDDYYFTLNEISAVMLHTTGIKSWNDKYGYYNNSKELELWNKYFKSQYNNLPFPGNDSTFAYYSWQDISYHDIKIIKYGDNKPSVSLNQFFNLKTSIPLPFTDYLLAHYKCDSTSFVFSGTTITQWNDSSPNSNNITNYRGTPIQRTFTKGSKGTTGSGSFNTVYGDFNSGFKLPFTLDSNYTFCYVARYVGDKTNITYNKRIFDSSSGVGENTWWGFNNNKTGVSYNYKNNYYTTQHKQHSEPDYWMIGIETQNTARFNGQDCTNYYEYLDNFYPLRYHDYNVNLTINYGFKTGDSGDNSEASNWEIAEMIFYNKELSDYEITEIEHYLANKFSHISFSNVVTNLDSFKTIVTSLNDLTDMWFYVYDGYKYSYNNVSGLFTGPVSFRFDLFKYDIGYPVVQSAVNDLFAWYKFDKDFTDSSGNANDLIVGGGIPTFSLTDSVIGQSANFLDGNNWVKTNSLNFDGGNWCFALWYKSTNTSSSDIDWILWQTPNSNNHYGGLYYHTGGIYEFHLHKSSTYYNQVTITDSSYASDRGTWVHLAVKQEIDGIIKIYRNGINIVTGTDTTITSDFSGYSMDFGYFLRGSRDAFGLMDDFRWYQRALTDAEILDLYTQYSTNQYSSKYYWAALVSNNNTNKETDTYDNRNNNNIKCTIDLADCSDDYFVHMVSLGGGGGGGKSKEDDTYRFSGSGGAGGLAYVSNKHIKNKIISLEVGSKGIGGTNILENSSGGDTTISWDYDNLVIGNGGYGGYDYGSNNLALGGAYSGGDGGDYGGNSIYEEDKMHRLGGKISNILKNVILQTDYNLYDIINQFFTYWMSHNFALGNDSSIYYGSGGIGARRNTSYDSNYVLASNGGPGCAIVIIDFNDINTERTSISIQKELKHKDYLINLVSYEARAWAIEFTRALGGTSRSNYNGSYGGYLRGNWNSTIIWIPVPKNYNCVVASGDNFVYATNIQIVRNATIDYTLTNGYTGGSSVYSNNVHGWRTHIYNNLKEGDIIKWYEGGSVIKKPYAIFLNVEQYVYNSDNDNGFGQTEYTLTFKEDTVCNVLIVAGGGGGGACQGYNPGGGGGAGEVLEKQVTFLASVIYIIKVGDGGDSSDTDKEPSKEGKDSGIFDIDGNIIYHCKGGGRGGFGRRVSTYDWPPTSGGCGGGAGRGSYYTDTSINYTGAPSSKYNIDGIGNDGRGWTGTQAGGGGGGELTFSSYLDYFYYDTYFNNDINWFQTNTHTSSGYTRYIQNIDKLTSNTVTTATTTSYSVEWFGYFKANRTGPFTFYLKSDDPAYLWIGENAKSGYTVDNALINNGSALVDNILEQNNSIDLVNQHYYPFRLQFGKNTGNNIMELHFKLPTDSDTTRRYDNNGYIYRFLPEGRIGGNPYLSYIIKPTDEYKNYITKTDYLYYSYTRYAYGGHGGYQYNQSFYNSLLTDTGNGGGGARAHKNNTTITAGQKGFSGIVIIDRNI